MILPIVAYGHPVLRKMSVDIDESYPNIQQLIADMWETMYASNGVGLAAPQINKPIRLFVLDSAQVFASQQENDQDEFPDAPGVKQVFINAHIKELDGDEWPYEEGCLSIPKIREDIYRPETVTVEYLDENFQPRVSTYNGLTARILQHEYDHLDGKLFIDHLKPLKRTLLKRKLDDISRGKIKVDYKMSFK